MSSYALSLPAISVLLPVFNAERYLGAALESVLAQTFTDFECVVVDDGSTDTSPTILAQYAAHDGRIRIIRQANLGIVAALNRGLAECRAPLVARMDADDICHPSRLAVQIAFLQTHPAVVAVGTAFRVIHANGRPGPVLQNPISHDAIVRALQQRSCLAHPTVMMRKATVLEAGGYREPLRHAEDYDLWARLADKHRLANLRACLLDYRVHPQQVSWEQAETQAIRTLAVRALAVQRRAHALDSLTADCVVDQTFLETLGVSSQQLEDAVFSALLGRLHLYQLLDMRSEAATIRNQLLSHAALSGATATAAARLAWADCESLTRLHRWPAAGWAFMRFVRTLFGSPQAMQLVCARLAGRLRV